MCHCSRQRFVCTRDHGHTRYCNLIKREGGKSVAGYIFASISISSSLEQFPTIEQRQPTVLLSNDSHMVDINTKAEVASTLVFLGNKMMTVTRDKRSNIRILARKHARYCDGLLRLGARWRCKSASRYS